MNDAVATKTTSHETQLGNSKNEEKIKLKQLCEGNKEKN